MFERYTERARRVLFFSRYEASEFGSTSIGTEHLLLGLTREGAGAFTNMLANANATLEDVRKDVEQRISRREKVSTSVEIPFDEDTKRALLYAAEEADRVRHSHVGPEHLFVALLRDERSIAGSILHARGLRPDEARNYVVQWVKAHPSSAPMTLDAGQVHQMIDAIKQLVDELAALPPGDQADAVRRDILARLDWFKGPLR